MMQYIFSPRWFYGVDIIFEIFSMFIVFLLARYGYKLYKTSQNRKHKYFAIFFMLIGVAFFFKIISNFDVYYMNVESIKIANSIFYFETSHVSEILFTIGFSLFRFLTMFSFFGLMYIMKERKKDMFYLGVYFIAMLTIFSESIYYVFHITMVVILIIVFGFYYDNYKRNAGKESLLTAFSFLMLLFSQIAFSLIVMDLIMYVVGEIFQLIGYSVLLFEYILVTKYEK